MAAMVLAGCGGEQTESEKENLPGPQGPETQVQMEIAGHRVPCQGLVKQFCLLVKEGNGPWRLQYDQIRGLDPTWSTTYRVQVGIREIPNPPADGSSREYNLRQLIQQAPVPADATFSFDIDRDLVVDDGLSLSLRNQRPFACADTSVCVQLRERLKSPSPFRLTFQHPGPTPRTTPQLTLTHVSDVTGTL